MILYRRRNPKVVSAGLVLTGGCYETVVFEGGSGGRLDAGTLDLGRADAGTPVDAATPDAATPDAATPDAATPDMGRRLDEVLSVVCETYAACSDYGVGYDECIEGFAYVAETYREAYGRDCYDAFLDLQVCFAEALSEVDCDPMQAAGECVSEVMALTDLCR